MPSTWERWGVDANGDGIADPWNAQDAVNAAARYLAASGGQTDISGAVFSYNHAQWYVDEVLQLARIFGAGGPSAAFSLDHVQQSLTDAQRDVVRQNRALVAALARARVLEREKQRLLERADRASLLSARPDLEKQAGL